MMQKQNYSNKPGNFTTKFFPELLLDQNEHYYIALDHLSMTASWHNIRPECENNKLRISKDKGKTFEETSFPSGVYDYEDINEFIHQKIGKLPGDDKNFGINVLFDLTTFKVFIQLDENYQIDFSGSGNFNVLLGFEKNF